MVNDLTETHHKPPKLALRTSTSLTSLNDNPIEDLLDNQNSINNPTAITSPPLFYPKHQNRLQMLRLNLFPKRKQFHQPKTHHRTSTLHPHQYNTQLYLIIQMSIQLQMTVSFMTFLSLMTLTALSKYIPKQITIFLRHLFNLKSFCFHLSYRTLVCQIRLSFFT